MTPAPGAVVATATPAVGVTLTDYPVGPGPYMRIGQALAGTEWDSATGAFTFTPNQPLPEGDHFVAVEWAGHTCSWRFRVQTQTAVIDGAGLEIPAGSAAVDNFVSATLKVRFRTDPHPGYAGDPANWQLLGNPLRLVTAAVVAQGQERWYTLTLNAGIPHYDVWGYALQYSGPGGAFTLPLGGGGGGAGSGGPDGPGGGAPPSPMSVGGGGGGAAAGGSSCSLATHSLLMDVLADETEDNWMVDTFTGSTGGWCGQTWPSCAYWLANTPAWNVYRKSHNVLWPVTGPLEGFVNEEIHHTFEPWTELVPPGDYRIMKGWIHTSDITWTRDLYSADLCTGAAQQNAGQQAVNDTLVEEIDLSGAVAGGTGGGDAPVIQSAQIMKGSDLPAPLAALVCDPGTNGGTPMPPIAGDLDPDACRYHPEHYYFAVEATDDYELWEDAKWFAFDKEYWGTPEREARIEEINDLLIACAGDNWDSAVRGCLLNLYETELTAEERLNICYWGDAIAAAWVDDPPLAPNEAATPVPGPVAGWADPVSISHDGRPDREHGWWVVNIPAPLCCKSSWYMVVRDKAANWRRAEPVDLPAQLVPSVTRDPQTGVSTIKYWGYKASANPPEEGGYFAHGDPDTPALEIKGRTFSDQAEPQYVNLSAASSGPALWGNVGVEWPPMGQRSRLVEFQVRGSAPWAHVRVLDPPFRPQPGANHSLACLVSTYKGDEQGWRDAQGDNALTKVCGTLAVPGDLDWDWATLSYPYIPPAVQAEYEVKLDGMYQHLDTNYPCLLLQDVNPTVAVPRESCYTWNYWQAGFWTETQWHTIRFVTSDYGSDNFQLAVCPCGTREMTDFVERYYEKGPTEPDAGEAIEVGSELTIWRKATLVHSEMTGIGKANDTLVVPVFEPGFVGVEIRDDPWTEGTYHDWLYWGFTGRRDSCNDNEGPSQPPPARYLHDEYPAFHLGPPQPPNDPAATTLIDERHSHQLLNATTLTYGGGVGNWTRLAYGAACDVGPEGPDRHPILARTVIQYAQDQWWLGANPTMATLCAAHQIGDCITDLIGELEARTAAHEVGHSMGASYEFKSGAFPSWMVDKWSDEIVGVPSNLVGSCLSNSIMEYTCLFSKGEEVQFSTLQVILALRHRFVDEEYPSE